MNKIFKNIGIPFWENEDSRTFIIPDDVRRLKDRDINVSVVASAGSKSGYSNKDYKDAGATVVLNNVDLSNCDLLVHPSKTILSLGKEFKNINIASFLSKNTKFSESEVKNIGTWMNISEINKDDHLVFKESQDYLAGQYLFYLIQGNQFLNSGILFSKIPGIEIPKIVVVGDSFITHGFIQEVLKSGCELTFIHDDYSVLQFMNSRYKNINTILFSEHDFIKKIKESDIVLCAGIKNKTIRQSHINNMKKNALFIDAHEFENAIDIKRDKNFYIYNNIKHYIVDGSTLNQSILKSSSIHLSIIFTDFILNSNLYTIENIVSNNKLNDKYKKPSAEVENKDIERLLKSQNNEELSWLDIEDQKDF